MLHHLQQESAVAAVAIQATAWQTILAIATSKKLSHAELNSEES